MQCSLNAVFLMSVLPWVAATFSCHQGAALTVDGNHELCDQIASNNFTSLPCVSGTMTADTCLQYYYTYHITMQGLSCTVYAHGGSCGFPGISTCDTIKVITEAFLDVADWTCSTCDTSNCNANPSGTTTGNGEEFDASNAYTLRASAWAVFFAVAAISWALV
mmetsp:Transcript_55938/g.130997  ORF Transcript_55938/g.130997 Transcript_55938/m.130997 type:complete len:163 (+) Transcript_55938:82-570(+)